GKPEPLCSSGDWTSRWKNRDKLLVQCVAPKFSTYKRALALTKALCSSGDWTRTSVRRLTDMSPTSYLLLSTISQINALSLDVFSSFSLFSALSFVYMVSA